MYLDMHTLWSIQVLLLLLEDHHVTNVFLLQARMQCGCVVSLLFRSSSHFLDQIAQKTHLQFH